MRKIGDFYILAGLIWLVLGMAFGIWMGISQQFNFANSHAHFNLVGFATSVLFGLIYCQYPGMGQSRLAIVQFWLYEIGAVLLVAGKAMVDGGGSDTLVKVGSIVVILGAILMAWIFAKRRALPA
ncbi:hypothetical protein ASD64_00885 [Mesorhizobium sp. Root157]|uniref:hypothetical protein n=1 Tax=Mesorhizobium sp. Root157 TaxID=1736477 RepID=UPI0007009ED0|nr:hypothetical protein [Mesorhizobium sp. Root157]KRA00163.1 hypothetical protein ASD64_00885 [Mesorhizobium sp. Root157]